MALVHGSSCQLLEESLSQLLSLRLHMINSRRTFRRNTAPSAPSAPSISPTQQLKKQNGAALHLKQQPATTTVKAAAVLQQQQQQHNSTRDDHSEHSDDSSASDNNDNAPKNDDAQRESVAMSAEDAAALNWQAKFCDELVSWWDRQPGVWR